MLEMSLSISSFDQDYIFLELAAQNHQQVFTPRPPTLKSIMASTDLDTLLEMGFDKARAELALEGKGDRKAPFVALLAYDIY